jgi:hypothetical protein
LYGPFPVSWGDQIIFWVKIFSNGIKSSSFFAIKRDGLQGIKSSLADTEEILLLEVMYEKNYSSSFFGSTCAK